MIQPGPILKCSQAGWFPSEAEQECARMDSILQLVQKTSIEASESLLQPALSQGGADPRSLLGYRRADTVRVS